MPWRGWVTCARAHSCLIKPRPGQPACYKSLAAAVFWPGLCDSRSQSWGCAGGQGAGQAMDGAGTRSRLGAHGVSAALKVPGVQGKEGRGRGRGQRGHEGRGRAGRKKERKRGAQRRDKGSGRGGAEDKAESSHRSLVTSPSPCPAARGYPLHSSPFWPADDKGRSWGLPALRAGHHEVVALLTVPTRRRHPHPHPPKEPRAPWLPHPQPSRSSAGEDHEACWAAPSGAPGFSCCSFLTSPSRLAAAHEWQHPPRPCIKLPGLS